MIKSLKIQMEEELYRKLKIASESGDLKMAQLIRMMLRRNLR